MSGGAFSISVAYFTMLQTSWFALLIGAVVATLSCLPIPVMAAPQVACREAAPGLVAWWRGEDNATDTVSGIDGVAGTGIYYAVGKVGRALNFTGSEGIEIPRDPGLNSESFTFETWVYPTQRDGGVDILICKEINGLSLPGIQFELGIKGPLNNAPGSLASGQLAFFLGGVTGLPDDFGGWTGGGGDVPLNRWSHVAITVDGRARQVTTYIHGIATRSLRFEGSMNHLDAPVRLGFRSPSPLSSTESFSGAMDETALYGRALDALEIRAIHAAGGQARCDRDASLQIVGLPERVAVGDPFSYTLELTVRGDGASGLRITNRFEGLEWVGITNTTGRSAARIAPDTLVWNVGDLPGSSRLRIQVLLRGSQDAVHRILASLGQDQADINPSNDLASASVQVQPLILSAEGQTPIPEGTGPASVLLRLFPASSRTVSVDYLLRPTVPVSAIPGLDYRPVFGTAVFPPGVTETNVWIPILDDFLAESSETFLFCLTNASAGVIQGSNVPMVITDDERIPAISVRSGRTPEGPPGNSVMRFEVELSGPSASPVSFQFSTVNDTARSGSDYVATNGAVTLPPGKTRTTFEVTILGDRTPESNEAFLVALSSPQGAVLERLEVTGVILNDDSVPGLVTGFRWGAMPAGLLDAGVPIPTTLTAVDGYGEVVQDFSASVNLGGWALGSPPATLKITEIAWGSVDGIEFQNVSTNVLQLSGWRISLYDVTRWPRPRATFIVPSGTSLNPSRVFTLTENGSSPGLLPSFRLGLPISWRDLNTLDSVGEPMAVLVQDETGRVVDFAGFDGAEANQIDLPVTLPTFDWSGPSVFIQSHLSGSAVRQGTRDSNTASDWIVPSSSAGASFGIANTSLTLPFAESNILPVDPPLVADFVHGVWSGNLRILQPSASLVLFADDGNGTIGRSDPLPMAIRNDLGVSLEPEFPQLAFGGSMRFNLTVTNPGPDIRSGIVVTTLLDRTVSIPLQITFPGEAPAVGIIPGSGNLLGFRWTVGTLPPRSSRTLEFRQQLSPLQPTTATNLVHEARLASPLADANPFNDISRCEVELARLCAVPKNVAAWWTSDQSDDTATVHLSLPGRLAARLVGARPGPGTAESGWVFSGAPGGVQVEASPAIHWGFGGTGGGLMEGWIRIDPLRNGGWIPVVGRHGTSQGWRLAILDGQLRLSATTSTGIEVVLRGSRFRTPFLDGRWHHLGLSQDAGGTTSLYVNGALAGSGLMPLLDQLEGSEPLIFGADPESHTLVGGLDEWSLIAAPGSPAAIAAAGSFGKCLYQLVPGIPEPLPPVGVGRPYSLELSVTNIGLSAAPEVRFQLNTTNTVRAELQSTPGTHETTPGTGSGAGAAFVGLFGNLAPGGSGRISLNLTATHLEAEPRVEFFANAPSRRGTGFQQPIPLVLSEDIDSDELPDLWEQQYGLSSSDPGDATLDRDGDGASNRDEYFAGTDPTNPTSRLQLSVVRTDSLLILQFQMGPNRSWILERSASLQTGGPWSPISEGRSDAIGSPIELSAPLETTGFFRVRLPPSSGN